MPSREKWVFFLMVLFLMFLFALFVKFVIIEDGPNLKTVHNTTDQIKLAEISLEAPNWKVRRAAVEKLVDQTLLAKIAVQSLDLGVRYAATKKLREQADLAAKKIWLIPEMTEKVSDQGLLSAIAFHAKNSKVRQAAIEKITNQVLLAKIAGQEKNPEVNLSAVHKIIEPDAHSELKVWLDKEETRKIRDQNKLAEIALFANDFAVRNVAGSSLRYPILKKMGIWVSLKWFKKVSNQALLAEIARYSIDMVISANAVRKINDKDLLVEIAYNAKQPYASSQAIIRLVKLSTPQELDQLMSNQKFAAGIVFNGNDLGERKVAIKRLTDQGLLTEIANSTWLNLELRHAAVLKLTNQDVLCQLAEKDSHAIIRHAAVVKVLNDSFLVNQLNKEHSESVRTAIVETLHSKKMLRKAAITAYNLKDRNLSLKRLQMQYKDPATDVIAKHKTLSKKVKSLSKVVDNNILLSFVLKNDFDVLVIEAARMLNDLDVIEQASIKVTNRDVLKILLEKQNNSEMLKRIASKAIDRAMRIAATKKSGMKSWLEIFETATNKSADHSCLGDTIAAVSLFSNVQPEVVSNVQMACLKLIKIGNESRILEMIDLLEHYGDKTLAEDYLNCGQPDLRDASKKWASRHGFTVNTGYGSNRAIWGSDR